MLQAISARNNAAIKCFKPSIEVDSDGIPFFFVLLPDFLPAISPYFKLLKPTGHVMHQQFNIRQLYVLPTLYLCVLYLSENKQRLVPLTA